MTEALQRAIFQEAYAAKDPAPFYASLLALVAGFSQEHIGADTTRLLLDTLSATIDNETMQ